jgi:REP element-mobilizing transposase RayT
MVRPSTDGFDSERLRKQWGATFGELRQQLSFRIVGYVPMPEHFHALIGPTPEVNPSRIMQKLEDRTALSILFWNDASVLAMDTVP